MVIFDTCLRKWRNGRRSRLKICRWQHRVGSTPIFRIKVLESFGDFFIFKFFENVLTFQIVCIKITPIEDSNFIQRMVHSIFSTFMSDR